MREQIEKAINKKFNRRMTVLIIGSLVVITGITFVSFRNFEHNEKTEASESNKTIGEVLDSKAAIDSESHDSSQGIQDGQNGQGVAEKRDNPPEGIQPDWFPIPSEQTVN